MPATTAREAEPPRIRVRKMNFPFAEADVPRWWFWDNPYLTHGANGLNMLFAPGERFFIRSVKHYMDRVDDPELRKRVKAFFGQEGRHGHEHERANKIIEGHGYELRPFLDLYERVAFENVERLFPPSVRLSVTVACEHFTATFAHNALTNPMLDGAPPVMRELLKWHAAEEIEHKSVAFDVLQIVDPRYGIRVLGLVLATAQLMGWWTKASRMLMEQEELSPEEKRHYREEARRIQKEAKGVDGSLIRRAFLDYLRPDFHPDQHEDYALATEYLASVGVD